MTTLRRVYIGAIAGTAIGASCFYVPGFGMAAVILYYALNPWILFFIWYAGDSLENAYGGVLIGLVQWAWFAAVFFSAEKSPRFLLANRLFWCLYGLGLVAASIALARW